MSNRILDQIHAEWTHREYAPKWFPTWKGFLSREQDDFIQTTKRHREYRIRALWEMKLIFDPEHIEQVLLTARRAFAEELYGDIYRKITELEIAVHEQDSPACFKLLSELREMVI